MLNLFNSNQKDFWVWFQEHSTTLIRDERSQNELVTKLHKYCDYLSFEISEIGVEEYEIVITAGGNSNYFKHVESLVNHAPPIKNWTITSFKQPKKREFSFEYEGITLNTDDIWFEPLENKKKPKDIGLMVYAKGYSTIKRIEYKEGMELIFQTILGEVSFSNDIKYYDIMALPEDFTKHIPIKDLPAYINWSKNRK